MENERRSFLKKTAIAGITHDAEGRPRGELEFFPVLPGHDLLTRGQQHMTGGRVDLLKRLIELCTVAKCYMFKLILSSWYYRHPFWYPTGYKPDLYQEMKIAGNRIVQ